MRNIQRPHHMIVLAVFVQCIAALPCFATVEPELTTAIRHKNVQRVQTLLSEGVNVNERDEGAEMTPLMWAVQSGNITVVQTLLNHGAAVNVKDDNGDTALSIALKKGYTKIAQILTSRGAKPSA